MEDTSEHPQLNVTVSQKRYHQNSRWFFSVRRERVRKRARDSERVRERGSVRERERERESVRRKKKEEEMEREGKDEREGQN